MSSTTEKIKERLDIVDVISSYIKLEPAGKNYKAACPFHSEKTPSFFVSPERESYYCFGCGRGGDVFTFVQEFEGLDFVGALKTLADKAGVELDSYAPKDADDRDRLYRALADAAAFYVSCLQGHKSASAYLYETRGVDKETAEQFGLGYAPGPPAGGWQELYTALKAKKYTDEELLRAGLVKRSEKGGYYDTFRSRIVCPVHDTTGRVVAFSGRIFEAESPAKYLNSPETDVFKKSRIVYGMDRAKGVIRKKNFAIIVEGNFDVVLAHQVGYRNTVAPLGTALSREHLEQIGRLSKNLVLALDADTAGITSAKKSAQLGLGMGFDVKIARLPNEKDPADVILEDAALWKQAVKEATHIVDFLIAMLRDEHEDDRTFRLAVKRDVLPFVAAIENKIDQGHFIQKIAETLVVDEVSVREELAKLDRDDMPSDLTTQEEGGSHAVDIEGSALRQLAALIVWKESGTEGEIDETQALRERLHSVLHDVSLFDDIVATTPREELLFVAEHAFGDAEDPDAIVEELFVRITEQSLRSRMMAKMRELKAAETAGDEEQGKVLFEAVHDLSQQLEKLREQKNK